MLDHSGSMAGVATGFAGEDVGMSKTGAAVAGLAGSSSTWARTRCRRRWRRRSASSSARSRCMPDGTRFMIIFFDDKLAAFTPRMTCSTRKLARPQSRSCAGSSRAARRRRYRRCELAYAQGAARVVLLSDGLANTGGGGDDLLAEARTEIRRGVRFDTVGIGIDQDSPLMTTLAAESGGIAVKR